MSKKIRIRLGMILLVLCLAGGFALRTLPAAALAAAKQGDISGDGQISSRDILTAYGILAGQTPPEGSVPAALDFDGDGRLGRRDVLRLTRDLENAPEGCGGLEGYLTLKLDATAAGLGVLAELRCPLYEDESGAQLLLEALEQLGARADYTGKPRENFTLLSIHRAGAFSAAAVPEALLSLLQQDAVPLTAPCGPDALGSQDFTSVSRWMWSVNGKLSSQGLDSLRLRTDDTLTFHFTLADSKDLGGFSPYGPLSGYCMKWTDGTETALPHSWTESARIEPTESSEGSVTYSCSRCHAEYTEVLPSLPPAGETPLPSRPSATETPLPSPAPVTDASGETSSGAEAPIPAEPAS